MAASTRKRSAFSMFKSAVPEKENNMAPSEIVSTPNLAQIGLAEYEEHKMAVKGKKRVRRGSLPSINQAEQEINFRSPTNDSKKTKRSQACKSEPRLNSLRKSFKRKKKDPPPKMNGVTNNIEPEREEQREKVEHNSINNNTEEKTETKRKRLSRVCSDSSEISITSTKGPLCQVQMSSSENLRSDADGVISAETLTAEEAIAWLIKPIDTAKFFRDVWEKKPLLLKRRQPAYNDGWFSTKEFDKILREREVKFGVNLDITRYTNGKRETLNPPGRAFAPVVWDFYQQGCSVRMLNPQSFSKPVWKLLSVLQGHFGSFVGANMYLTPPGTQGFAPHYDDIEAFIIQLEGKKQWKLYSPRNVSESLPRFSSANLSQEEIGEPILDKVLEPGDCLYFPRGYIHQATTPEESHSLHITLSVYQMNSWGDFLEKLLPRALQLAMEEDVEFRKGLPIGYLNHVGVSNSDKTSVERSEFLKRIQQLVMKVATYAPVDIAADEMATNAMQDMLPPVLTEEELMCSVHGNGAFWDNGCVRGESMLDLQIEVRVIRPETLRLTVEDEVATICHTMENSRVYHEVPAQTIEISTQEIEAAEYIINSYPSYITIESVPMKRSKARLEFVSRLYNNGILRTKAPLRQDSAV